MSDPVTEAMVVTTINGALLEFSIQENRGIILGDDGRRYQFVGSEWKLTIPPAPNMRLNFEVASGTARSIFAQPGTASASRPSILSRPSGGSTKLYRSIDDKILGGICSGVAHLYNYDKMIVRVIAVVILVFPLTGWAALIAYIVGWCSLPAVPTKGVSPPNVTA